MYVYAYIHYTQPGNRLPLPPEESESKAAERGSDRRSEQTP